MPKKINRFIGTIQLPGDKSISHRSLIIGSQATGIVKISNLLESGDIFSTIQCLKKFGIKIIKKKKNYFVYGKVVGGLEKFNGTLNCGNSGTTARLLLGLLSTYPYTIKFIGDKSLSKRPMGRVIDVLKHFGASVKPSNKNNFPLTFRGSFVGLQTDYKLKVASAQIKSAFLLAALNTPGISSIEENFDTRDHTEIMLKYLGAKIQVKKKSQKKIIFLEGKMPLDAKDIYIPGDISSASFMIVLALISKNSKILVKNVLLNPTRTGILDALKKMKAQIQIKNKRLCSGEIIGDLFVRSSKLRSVTIQGEMAPRLIDEYPILFIAALFAKGTSKFYGIEELRFKESDRIETMKEGLSKVGINIKSTKSSVEIKGNKNFNVLNNSVIDAKGDHRIAMSFKILSEAINKKFRIKDFQYVQTSFPTFIKILKNLKKN